VHVGSVDVFLEAARDAPRGGVLAVDNGGRLDEGCVGDLTALEMQGRGLAGMVVWGAHRDTADLAGMGFPCWSLGTCPSGPRRLDARPAHALQRARLGDETASRQDWVYADDDGALLVAAELRGRVEEAASRIVATERGQAQRAREGVPLSSQLDLEGYLAARRSDPSLTFRQHLRARGGAIEE
jgi:regulator of RNase E activity RraA